MASKNQHSIFWRISHFLHLWVGLVCSIVLFVICLTGTIFVFHNEMDRALNAKVYKINRYGLTLQSVEALKASIEKQSQGKVMNITIPHSQDVSWIFAVKPKDKALAKKSRHGIPYYVNPYSGEIVQKGPTRAARFFTSIENIHRWFFIGKGVAKYVTGFAVLGFIILLITGAVIWIPKKIKFLKDNLTIKWSANWKRKNYDMHRVWGIYCVPIIFVCAVTGLCWSFGWWRSGVSKVIGAPVFKTKTLKAHHVTASSSHSVHYYAFVLRTKEAYDGNSTVQMSLPKDSSTALICTASHNGWFDGGIDRFEFNPYTGEVLSSALYKDMGFGEKIAYMTRAIHVGEEFGIFSKFLYFLCALLATTLPITGIFIYVNKLKKK